MWLHTILALLFFYILPAPFLTNALVIPKSSPVPVEALLQTVNASRPHLEKRYTITDWNNDHPNNQIADVHIPYNAHGLICTAFTARSVWDAFNRGLWFVMHQTQDRPRWAGNQFPHTLVLQQYHARRVDLGEADGEIYVFPLNPGLLGEWPGLNMGMGPVFGPPGPHRVVFDDRGVFVGVAVMHEAGWWMDDRLVWCYPIYPSGARDSGATAEGHPGVDEAWRDTYDGFHYVYAPDPADGSRPPHLGGTDRQIDE
ncbi:hypothetical protein F5B19DRAFT_488662 [Rostrohypoxylon terebratum]|nr:hypothetical protein F5B19DRAFT_488662 [Rostrohypoxylon terebratum]